MKKLFSIVAIIAVIGVAVVGFLFLDYSGDVKGGKGSAETVTVEIPKGSGANSIATILADNGIIKNSLYFKLYAKQNPMNNLQYGSFELSEAMSYDELVKALSTAKDLRETVTVTFPEGFSLMQMAQGMENNGLCTAEEFIDVANNGDFSQFEFWNKIKEHEHKFMKGEGYLYPETYEFFKDDDVYNMVAKMYEHFDSQITDDMYAQMDKLGMSLDEVITLASFVQEEAGHEKDQYGVAACLRNRIKEGSPQPALECNVCSYINEPGNYVYDYIVTYYGGVGNVPAGMMEAYDTYKIIGLPPSPISNPGITAIKATLWPDQQMMDDGYYFFVTDLAGTYHYSKTYAEHLANCEKAYAINASLNK